MFNYDLMFMLYLRDIFKDDMPGLAHFCEHLLFMVCIPLPEQYCPYCA
jgi:hypothetical protein